jgi:transposase
MAGGYPVVQETEGHVHWPLDVSFLLHRLGFSPQVPAHRAFERDEDAVAEWRSATWAKVRG